MRERDLGIHLSGDSQSKDVNKSVTKSGGLKGELESISSPDRDEHSVLGRVLGTARDLFQGEAHTLREKQERAATNDEIAKIAVDTVASIPEVHFVTGGLVRAASMANPNEGMQSNLVSGALNFAEGIALNKVSRISTDGVHGLMRSGAAMGAIRTSFDQNTWLNKDGHFDTLAGAEHVATGTITGAFINVPAGLLGSRVSRHLGAESATPTAVSKLLSHMASGYASGSVFGGLDAVVAGGNAKDVLSAMNSGGVTGALTGGLVHGLSGAVGRLSEAKISQSSFNNLDRVYSNIEVENPTREFNNHDLHYYSHRQQMEHVYKQFWFEPKPRPEFVELTPRLIQRMGFTTATELKVHPKDANKVWANETEFAKDLVPEKVDMVVHGVRDADGKKSPVEIHVPVKYNNSVLEPVRALRATASTDLAVDENLPLLGYVHNVFTNGDLGAYLAKVPVEKQQLTVDAFNAMSPEELAQTKKVLDARQALDAHPHKFAILPEDVLPYLEQSMNVKKIVLSDKNWAYDTWMRQNKNPDFYREDFTAAATAAHATGTITFYKGERPIPEKPQTATLFSDLFNHEDTHLMRGFKPAYDAAHTLDFKHFDDPAYSISDYAKSNEEEDRAESRMAFLQSDPTGFWLMSEQAPLRAAVLAKAESKYLDEFAEAGRVHPYEHEFTQRIVHAEAYVVPTARAQAVGHLHGDDPERSFLAARLLGTIGSPEDIPELERIAKADLRAKLYAERVRDIERGAPTKSHAEQLAENERAYDPANQHNKAAREAFESIVKLSGDKPEEQFKPLVDRAIRDPQLRHLAVEKMEDGSFGAKGVEYGAMLRNFGHPANVKLLIRDIEATKDPALKAIGFAEVMRLTAHRPADQEYYANKIYHEQSALQDDALAVLMRYVEARRPK